MACGGGLVGRFPALGVAGVLPVICVACVVQSDLDTKTHRRSAFSVDSQAGGVASRFGVTVSIPPGGVARDATLTIDAAATPEADESLTAVGHRISEPVAIASDQELVRPAQIEFVIDPSDVATTEPFAAMLDERTHKWSAVAGDYDPTTATLTVSSRHFSVWAVLTWSVKGLSQAFEETLVEFRQWSTGRTAPPACEPTPDLVLDFEPSREDPPLYACAEGPGPYRLKLTNNRAVASAVVLPAGVSYVSSKGRSPSEVAWDKVNEVLEARALPNDGRYLPGGGELALSVGDDAHFPIELELNTQTSALVTDVMLTAITPYLGPWSGRALRGAECRHESSDVVNNIGLIDLVEGLTSCVPMLDPKDVMETLGSLPSLRDAIKSLGSRDRVAVVLRRSESVRRYFQTPSGNIFCIAYVSELFCESNAELHPEPKFIPGTSRTCPLDWTGIAMRAGTRAIPVCAGDTIREPHAPALPYGVLWSVPGFRCLVRVNGLRCTTEGGHGFFLSRDSWSAD